MKERKKENNKRNMRYGVSRSKIQKLNTTTPTPIYCYLRQRQSETTLTFFLALVSVARCVARYVAWYVARSVEWQRRRI